MGIELFTGNRKGKDLYDISKIADLSRTLSATEVATLIYQFDSLNGTILDNITILTGNFAVYRFEGSELLFSLVPVELNFIFNNLENAVREGYYTTPKVHGRESIYVPKSYSSLKKYFLSKENLAQLIDSEKKGETFVCNFSDLNTQFCSNPYIDVNIAKGAGHDLMQKVFGKEYEHLEEEGSNLKISFESPENISRRLRENLENNPAVGFLTSIYKGHTSHSWPSTSGKRRLTNFNTFCEVIDYANLIGYRKIE